MDRVRDREVRLPGVHEPSLVRLHERATIDELADEFLEEERVPLGAFYDRLPEIVRERGRHHLLQHL